MKLGKLEHLESTRQASEVGLTARGEVREWRDSLQAPSHVYLMLRAGAPGMFKLSAADVRYVVQVNGITNKNPTGRRHMEEVIFGSYRTPRETQ